MLQFIQNVFAVFYREFRVVDFFCLCYSFYMKKLAKNCFITFFLISIFFTFISCRENSSSADNSDSESFIQKVFSERSFSWVPEIEGKLLSEERSSNIHSNKNLSLTPVSYGVFVANKMESVYPFIEGFASLDLTLLDLKAKGVVRGFCDAFCSSSAMDSFMAAGSMSELVFFKTDSEKYFDTDKKETVTYIYGSPFISDDTFEVPVCFISSAGRLIVYLYLDKKSDWKIEQIQIKKWQVS